jgi:diacylglycerol kinase family enzyme
VSGPTPTLRAVGFLVVLNPGSGSADDIGELAREARSRLGAVRSIELASAELPGAVDEAVAEGGVVVAAGGDGTVNAVAQLVVGKGTLGVVPAGTLNHFARDLGVDDPDAAFAALATGRTRTIDVGKLNGQRFFLNNVGIGLYPEMVYRRDRVGQPAGKWLAAAGASVRLLRESRPVTGKIIVDHDPRILFAWMVFVGNNRFGTTPGRIGQRENIDEGILDVGLFLAGPRGARRSSVAWRVLRSRPWETSTRVIRRQARRVEVRLAGEPQRMSWDGEAGDRVRGMEAEIVPRALRVVVAPEEG